ncbi:MAG: carboxypeptidase regulatory-like domain-containing protein [Bacteroidales bacterium]|nr:carboxypeptidase regulatory-like domain-containing protein [Bacteroidales bacterium]
MKKLFTAAAALLISALAFAQVFTGGIKGTVVSRAGRVPVPGAELVLSQNGKVLTETASGSEGQFLIENLPDGIYQLDVKADEFSALTVFVTVDQGFIKDLIFVSLTPEAAIMEADESNYAEFDMDDSGYSDTPTLLLGSNDVYTNVAGYGFSSVRFKNRGYNSETQDVYLAGVKMNDAITGYSPFSLWSGLNEAMRSKDTTIGLETADEGFGGFNGVTNLHAVPTSVRTGWRFSVLSNSALYRMRLMASYASGENNGWSYAFNASVRMGGNDWIEGVYYRSFAYYLGIGKRLGEGKLSLITFATPGERGAQNASTQEVYNLMGDNMYNSNWGYQNGKVRNSRVRKTFEPVTLLKYEYASESLPLTANATLLWRTGSNGYTALDWYDAMDPRPDYYRNLPSYYYMEDEDYNRVNQDKYEWTTYAWTQRGAEYANYQHLNWDRLYNVNYHNAEGRSKYALEERHVDQNDIQFAANAKLKSYDGTIVVKGGMDFRANRTENYKKMNDLLGGRYFLNIDSFAERDFAANEALLQNDLDYYLQHGSAEKIKKGGKYGYDYLAQIRVANAWVDGTYKLGQLTATAGAKLGATAFWREGLVRKGLFAGANPDGSHIYATDINGQNIDLTALSNGQTSYGKSATAKFITYAAKASVAYDLFGNSRVSANVGYFNDAPTFNNSFISPRTRNTIVDDLRTQKTFSADINYQIASEAVSARVTGFFTKIMDQTDVMSFYDDSQQSFTNFAMTGIDQRHMGVELGVKVPLPVKGLSVSGVLSLGEYIYTSTPHMVQTVDNSAEVVRDDEVTYWQQHPVYVPVDYTAAGVPVYDENLDGSFKVDHYQKHYVPSTPQLATELALNYRTNSYWFFELNGQYFDNAYLDMNPLYRTSYAARGSESNPAIISEMTYQEKFKAAFLMNASAGKSWSIQRKYYIGFSLNVSNFLNNKEVKTGGYEQTRLISSVGKDRYYRFDPKYFYMQGANYMLNIYFRF